MRTKLIISRTIYILKSKKNTKFFVRNLLGSLPIPRIEWIYGYQYPKNEYNHHQ